MLVSNWSFVTKTLDLETEAHTGGERLERQEPQRACLRLRDAGLEGPTNGMIVLLRYTRQV